MPAEYDVTRLNEIIKNTVSVIGKSKEEVYDIAESARRENNRLQEELAKTKLETTQVIDNVEKLQEELKANRRKLALLSKNFDKVSQDELRSAYEKADKVRIDLAVFQEKEKYLIKKRNDLELRIKNSDNTVQKAETLVLQMGTAIDYLAGDLSNLNEKLEDVEKKKYLSIRIIKAQENERSRIAREMHDGPAQSMSNIVLKAELCEKLVDVDPKETKLELKNIKSIVRDNLKDIRRMIYDLRPMTLDDLGLIPTIRQLVDEYNKESKIKVSLTVFGEDNLNKKGIDKNVSLTIFRLIQEGLNNIKKHSNALNTTIKLEFASSNVILHIIDDGKGFDTEKLRVERDETQSGFGLFSMQERINLLNGSLEIISQLSKGTKIIANLPYVIE